MRKEAQPAPRAAARAPHEGARASSHPGNDHCRGDGVAAVQHVGGRKVGNVAVAARRQRLGVHQQEAARPRAMRPRVATSHAATSHAATSHAATSHAATSHAATSHAATSHAATCGTPARASAHTARSLALRRRGGSPWAAARHGCVARVISVYCCVRRACSCVRVRVWQALALPQRLEVQLRAVRHQREDQLGLRGGRGGEGRGGERAGGRVWAGRAHASFNTQ